MTGLADDVDAGEVHLDDALKERDATKMPVFPILGLKRAEFDEYVIKGSVAFGLGAAIGCSNARCARSALLMGGFNPSGLAQINAKVCWGALAGALCRWTWVEARSAAAIASSPLERA